MHQKKGHIRFLFSVLTVVLLLTGAAQADWTAPSFISTAKQYDYLYQGFPDMTEGPDGTLHAVWSSYETLGSYPNSQYLLGIKYAQSSDNGATWSAPVDIASTTFMYSTYRGARVLVGPNGRIHVSYYYLNYYGYSSVNAAYSDDNGQTWHTSWLQGGCFPWFISPALDQSGNVYTAWERWKCNNSTLPSTVFFSRSMDSGNTWSGPLGVSPGGVIQVGYQLSPSLAADDSGNLHLIYENPADAYSPGYGISHYARSADQGLTWTSQPAPAGFGVTGIYAYGDKLLTIGQHNGADAFLRSVDSGYTWEGPIALPQLPGGTPMSQVVVDSAGTYYAFKDQSFVRSSDGGQTWTAPEYMGNGTFSRLLTTRNGDIFGLGQFPCQADSCVGLVKYKEPFGVDAPDFLSTWEKASFRYSFKVRGVGEVRVSFPKDAIALEPGTVVTAGNQTVPAVISAEGDRIIASFPVEAADWTSCSLPITVTKGSMEKWASIRKQIEQLNADFRAAAEAEQAESAEQIDAKRRDLQAELTSSEREFVVSVIANGEVKASDRTAVSIYEHLTSVYLHLKADASKDTGADLLLKSADTIAVDISQPFLLEVKVTHLKAGKTAAVSLAGNYTVNDVIVENAVGTHKSDFYLFYAPSFTGQSDEILVTVTIDGVAATVPVHVTLN